jgi:hypothetical protein
MANPWMKKNPVLSLWLSAACAGTMTAAANRQIAAWLKPSPKR